MAPLEWWRPPGGPHAHQVRELLRAVMGLHSTWAQEIWLWRGQSDAAHGFEPGMHTRVRITAGLEVVEQNVIWATSQLIESARANRLDVVEDLRLPDLALLAHLQHHGAGTPLLDVTVDPLVALWMVAHASGSDPTAEDDREGALFAVRRPADPSRWFASLDSRPYRQPGESDIATAIAEAVHWYRAPDISERLRIQRGSFLIGPLAANDTVTFPLVWDTDTGQDWLGRRIEGLGLPGRRVDARSEVVRFRVTSAIKYEVRSWLQDRAGLTQDVIYPTPWHRPFLEEFCRTYGRSRPIDYPKEAASKGA